MRNAACSSPNGEILARYDKRELPNYGVFDEERTFSPGRGSLHIETPGGALALTICEDIWLPDAVAEAAALGATCVLNISASPYHLGKGLSREEMLRRAPATASAPSPTATSSAARTSSSSTAAAPSSGPTATVLARAASFAEELLVCDSTSSAAVGERLRDSRLRRGRRRASHPPVTVELPLGGERPPRRAVDRAAPPAGADGGALGRAAPRPADYVRKNGFERVVLGLSGGIDSALVAALAADALGAEQVEAVSHADALQQRRARAATRASSPSGSASRSASSRSRICASRSRTRCPARAASPPRTCRRASAACC